MVSGVSSDHHLTTTPNAGNGGPRRFTLAKPATCERCKGQTPLDVQPCRQCQAAALEVPPGVFGKER